MKKETDVKCKKIINGVECRGALFKDLGISRMAESFGHRHYKCDKCGTKWLFTPKGDHHG